MQYSVGVGPKKSTHTVYLANMGGGSHSVLIKYWWWGPLPLVQKGQTHAVGYAVHSRYAVCSRC